MAVNAFISIRFVSMCLSQVAVLSTTLIKGRFANKMLVFQKAEHSPVQPFKILKTVFWNDDLTYKIVRYHFACMWHNLPWSI